MATLQAVERPFYIEGVHLDIAATRPSLVIPGCEATVSDGA
jgi:hypothetical protein